VKMESSIEPYWNLFGMLSYISTKVLLIVYSLKESHTGEYLAKVIADCVDQFGIAGTGLF
jgi:hypothetical protein